jgi:hypothetical protein
MHSKSRSSGILSESDRERSPRSRWQTDMNGASNLTSSANPSPKSASYRDRGLPRLNFGFAWPFFPMDSGNHPRRFVSTPNADRGPKMTPAIGRNSLSDNGPWGGWSRLLNLRNLIEFSFQCLFPCPIVIPVSVIYFIQGTRI